MTLRTGLAVNSVSIDAPDVRLAQAGLIVRGPSGAPRSGLFPHTTASLITARTDMRVDVAAFAAAFSRSASYGAVLFSNDGTVQSPALPAPTANSWTYLLYVAVPDTTAGDAAALPSLQVVRGAAAAIPQKPALPTGGLELGTVTIPSTATTTQSANVVITPTYQFTAAQGSAVYFRTEPTLRASITGWLQGQLAYAVDTMRYFTWDGDSWEAIAATERLAHFTTFANAVPDTNQYPVGSITPGGESVNNDFATIGTDGNITLLPGTYEIVLNTVLARRNTARGWNQITRGAGASLEVLGRGNMYLEDYGTTATLVRITAAGGESIRFLFTKTTTVADTVTGSIRIRKLV